MNETTARAFADTLSRTIGQPLVRLKHAHGLSASSRAGAASPGGDDYELRLNQKSWRLRFLIRDRMPSPDELNSIVSETRHLRHLDPSNIAVLVVPKLLPRHQDMLREAEVSHADLRGNARIMGDGLFIDIERSNRTVSHKVAYENDSLSRAPQDAPNPFQDRTTLLLRALLVSPTVSHRLTDLASAAGVSIAWASRATREFIRRGYAVRVKDGVRLSEPERVLRDWGAEYRWSDNTLTRFSVPYGGGEIQRLLREYVARTAQRSDTPPRIALTLHAGASLLAPHVQQENVAIYVSENAWNAFEAWVEEELQAEYVPTGGNLQLTRPFYAHSVFTDVRTLSELPVVSPVQLYLDLLHYPLRGSEAATILLRTVLAKELALGPAQVSALSQDLK